MDYKETKLEVGGCERITLEKLFGPCIFADLRITVDPSRGWVIERQRIGLGPIEWVEQCVIPAQLDEEFED